MKRLIPAGFIRRDTCYGCDEGPAFHAPQAENRVHHSLPNDRVSPGRQSSLANDVDDVPQSNSLGVYKIFPFGRPIQPPCQLDFGAVYGEPAGFIAEPENNLRHSCRPSTLRSGKDDVLGLPTAKIASRLLSQDPSEGIHEIALATAIGTHHGGDAIGKLNYRRGRKGLEPC